MILAHMHQKTKQNKQTKTNKQTNKKQKPKNSSMDQDRKPRDKPTHLWSPNLKKRRQEYTMEKR